MRDKKCLQSINANSTTITAAYTQSTTIGKNPGAAPNPNVPCWAHTNDPDPRPPNTSTIVALVHPLVLFASNRTVQCGE